MGNVKFNCTDKDFKLVDRIAKRAHQELEMTMAIRLNPTTGNSEKIELKNQTEEDTHMDIIAVHMNGCRLDLQRLLEFDDFNFAHDIYGIRNCIDRSTGKLLSNFIPRCRKSIRKKNHE